MPVLRSTALPASNRHRARRLLAGHRMLGRRTSAPSPYLPVTCAADEQEHRVSVPAVTRAMLARTGQCRALCGHLVTMVSPGAPSGPACPLCASLNGGTR